MGTAQQTGFRELVSQSQGFASGSVVKNLPAMQEMRVRPLGQEDPLEKGMATHSSILAGTVPQTGEPSGLQSCWTQLSKHAS